MECGKILSYAMIEMYNLVMTQHRCVCMQSPSEQSGKSIVVYTIT